MGHILLVDLDEHYVIPKDLFDLSTFEDSWELTRRKTLLGWNSFIIEKSSQELEKNFQQIQTQTKTDQTDDIDLLFALVFYYFFFLKSQKKKKKKMHFFIGRINLF